MDWPSFNTTLKLIFAVIDEAAIGWITMMFGTHILLCYDRKP